MQRFLLRIPRIGIALLFLMTITTQTAYAQSNFTNSGQVGAGSPVSGTLTDAIGNSVGYEVSTIGPLLFGWNGHAGSELGGVQTNFPLSSSIVDWVFSVTFDRPIDQLTVGQTPFFSTGANAGGTLAFFSDASNVGVDFGTPGLGPDGLSNLNSAFIVNGGDVIANLAPTFSNEDDWLVTLNDLQNLTVLYQPIGGSTAEIGSEWFTFESATVGAPVAVIPEPSALFGLTCLLSGAALRRRRS